MKIARIFVLLGLGAAVLASPAIGADQPAERQRWGFSGSLAFGGAGGDYGNALEKYVSGNYELFKTSPNGGWRYGAGFGFGSFALKPPFQDEEEFALMQTYLFGAKVFRPDRGIRPYIKFEAGLSRLHPRAAALGPQPPPEELPPGESPTEPSTGFGLGVLPGVEMALGGTGVSLDASLYAYWSTTNYDLSAIGQPNANSGTSLGGRLGLTWIPNGSAGGPGPTDPWGVHKSYGWATGEVVGMNLLLSQVNEYVLSKNFNQVSPRSWWANIEEGFTYDDNDFRNNQFLHPVNGQMYFTGARYHGHGFWVSGAYAVGGSLIWECCGETHPMSFNDLISTGIGGTALGEMTFRMSSKILDNTAHGKKRFFREAGAFLVSPIRGFNRLVSGHVNDTENPADPMEWRPPGGGTFMALGARTIGRGESISENTRTTGYFEWLHAYGSAFDNERNKPYDSFTVLLQFNFGDKVPLGQAQILGTLWKKPLGDSAQPNHVFEITQHFDYMNNEDFEFGGQSFGPTLLSRFDLGGKWGLRTRLDGNVMILGAINSEYAKIADVANRERLREYDYGPGLGTEVLATLTRNGRGLLAAGYRFQWINVSNGSIYNNDQLGISTSAEHYIQIAVVRLVLPIKGNFGIGADGAMFFRKSRYDIEAFKDIDQRNPQARVYLTVNGFR
jgi:uncharacterized protein DUF3943